jgi:ribonuclease HI
MKTLTFNFDGGNEKNIAVWAFVSKDSDGNDGPSGAGRVPIDLPQTNNVAEWSALLWALKKAEEVVDQYDKFVFLGDSELVIKQMRGIYACKQAHLVPLFNQCRQLHNGIFIDRNTDCQYNHVRREFNTEADALGRKYRNENVA